MAHRFDSSSPISPISIVPFKTQEVSGKYGAFSNTTPDGMLTVRQTVVFDSKSEEEYHWASGERCYQAQKVIDFIRYNLPPAGERRTEFFRIGKKMLREIETGGKLKNGEFLPRDPKDPTIGYDGIVREYLPLLIEYSQALRDTEAKLIREAELAAKTAKTAKTARAAERDRINAPVVAFAKLARATKWDREKNKDRMRRVCGLKQETNPEFEKLVQECLRDGVIPCEISKYDSLWALPGNELGLLHLEEAFKKLEKNYIFDTYRITDVRATWGELMRYLGVRGIGSLTHKVLIPFEGQKIQFLSNGRIISSQEIENQRTSFEQKLLEKKVLLICHRQRAPHAGGYETNPTTIDFFFPTQEQAQAIHRELSQQDSNIVNVVKVANDRYLGGEAVAGSWKVSTNPLAAKALLLPTTYASLNSVGETINTNGLRRLLNRTDATIDPNLPAYRAGRAGQARRSSLFGDLSPHLWGNQAQSSSDDSSSDKGTPFEVELLRNRVCLIRHRQRPRAAKGYKTNPTTIDFFFPTQKQAKAIYGELSQRDSNMVNVVQVSNDPYLGGNDVAGTWKVSTNLRTANALLSPPTYDSLKQVGKKINGNDLLRLLNRTDVTIDPNPTASRAGRSGQAGIWDPQYQSSSASSSSDPNPPAFQCEDSSLFRDSYFHGE